MEVRKTCLNILASNAFRHVGFIITLTWLIVTGYASVTTGRAPLCSWSASDSVAETLRTVPLTHVANVCFERGRSTQRARSGYWTVCNNCCVRCISCRNLADTCVQRTAVHLWRALAVRFGRSPNGNLMPAWPRQPCLNRACPVPGTYA